MMKNRLLLVLLCLAGALRAQSTLDAGARYFAWSANTGWINCRPSGADGIVVAGTMLAGHAYAANVGWIHFGNGSPPNGWAYTHAGANDYGVNHDGAGNLSGWAYGANIGWISFGWASATDAQRPRFDLFTGVFSGFAYGANVGWINLGESNLRTLSIAQPDSDSDGISDAWERQWFGALNVADAATDHDADGVSDQKEFAADSNPLSGASRLRITQHSFDPLLASAMLQFAPTSSRRQYRIDFSTELQPPWISSAHGVFAPDPGGTTARSFSFPTASRMFFRVVPLLPLQP